MILVIATVDPGAGLLLSVLPTPPFTSSAAKTLLGPGPIGGLSPPPPPPQAEAPTISKMMNQRPTRLTAGMALPSSQYSVRAMPAALIRIYSNRWRGSTSPLARRRPTGLQIL